MGELQRVAAQSDQSELSRSHHDRLLHAKRKNLSNTTDGFRSTGSAGSTIAYPQNPLNPSEGERGLGRNDFVNVVGIGFTYQLSEIRQRRFVLASDERLLYICRSLSLHLRTGLHALSKGITVDSNTGDSSFCDGAFNAQTVGADTLPSRRLEPQRALSGSVAYLNP